MDKMPSPWSIEFRETNTIAKVEPDEIQHRGNKNSGRYKRGSKNNPSTGMTRQNKIKGDRPEIASDKAFLKQLRKMPKVPQTKAEKEFAKGLRKRMKNTAKELMKDENIKRAGLIGGGVAMAVAMKPYKKEIQKLNIVIAASKKDVTLANKLYNTPEVVKLEAQYLSGKEKYMDHGDSDDPRTTYQAMAKEKRAVCWYLASLITTDTEEAAVPEKTAIKHSEGGTIDGVFSSFTDEEKMVVFYLAMLITAAETT